MHRETQCPLGSLVFCYPHPPSDETIETVLGLAEAAIRQGIEAYIYPIDEGVKSFKDRRFSRLLEVYSSSNPAQSSVRFSKS
jgi:hypothetical protein